jgi:hypothetical protein
MIKPLTIISGTNLQQVFDYTLNSKLHPQKKGPALFVTT